MRFQDWVELKAAAADLPLRMRRPTQKELDRARSILARPPSNVPMHRAEAAHARWTMTAQEWPETLAVMLQVFRIGELAVAAIPFEAFTETGFEIQRRSPFRTTLVVELANGGNAYLPTPEHHQLGGYETWLGTSRFETEASTKVENKLVEMLSTLR